MRRVYTLLVASFALFIQGTALYSQSSVNNAGTDFFLSFLPAVHTSEDTLYLAFYSNYLSSGTIELKTFNGITIKRAFRVNDTRRATYIGFAASDIELRGSRRDSTYQSIDQAESVLNTQVLKIHSDSAVMVAMITNSTAGSSVSTVLPTSVLGRSYVVSTSASVAIQDTSAVPAADWHKSSPSQCAIIASHDNTDVRIQLRIKTSHESAGIKQIRLNQGECYFFQSEIDTNAAATDLSGTMISANRPIAVFAGHQNAVLPSIGGFESSSSTRTFLNQQLTPVERWSTSSIAIPLNIAENGFTSGQEFVRIYAVVPKTEIYFDEVLRTTVDPGGFYEEQLDKARYIRSSSPVYLMQYTKTQSTPNNALGNGGMFSAPSIDQWKSAHLVNAIQTRIKGQKVFGSQYLIVVAPTSAMKSVVFDGEPAANGIVDVGSSGYSYFTRKVADGIHSVSCDSACSVIMYGISADRRYAYCPSLEYPSRAYMKPSIRVPDVSAKIGDTVMVSVIIDSLTKPPAILGLRPTSYSFDLCFNSTVMTPAESSKRGVIENGKHVIHSTGNLVSVSASTTMLSIPMICGLGDAEVSTISVSNLHWYDDVQDTIPLDYVAATGKFSIRDVWHDSLGARLVNPQVGDIKIEITPNPVAARAFINCSSGLFLGEPPTMILYNQLGEVVRDFTNSLVKFSGASQILFDVNEIPPGVYYLRFAIANKSEVKVLVIE